MLFDMGHLGEMDGIPAERTVFSKSMQWGGSKHALRLGNSTV